MTILEFEGWVSDNYDELVGLAARVLKGHHRATDILHEVIEAVCEDQSKLPPAGLEDTVGWFRPRILHRFYDYLDSADSETKALGRFAQNAAVLGTADAQADQTRAKAAIDQRRAKLKRQSRLETVSRLEREASHEVRLGHLFYGQDGITRWRYQTLRDNKLFDERAVRSLAESMHRASQRYRHHGEHGFSFTEFGQEIAR